MSIRTIKDRIRAEMFVCTFEGKRDMPARKIAAQFHVWRTEVGGEHPKNCREVDMKAAYQKDSPLYCLE